MGKNPPFLHFSLLLGAFLPFAHTKIELFIEDRPPFDSFSTPVGWKLFAFVKIMDASVKILKLQKNIEKILILLNMWCSSYCFFSPIFGIMYKIFFIDTTILCCIIER